MINVLSYSGGDKNYGPMLNTSDASNDRSYDSLLNVVYFPNSDGWTYHSETTPALIVCRHNGCVIYNGTVWDLNGSSGGSGNHGSMEYPYYLTPGHIYIYIYRIVKNQKRREEG